MLKHDKKVYFLENLLLFTAFSTYFVPGIQFSSMQVKIDDFIVLFFLPYLFLYKPKMFLNPIIITLALVLTLMLISMYHGYLFLDVPQSSRDINEFVRLSKPFIFSLLLLRCDSHYLLKTTDKVMPIMSILLIIIGFIQYFNFGGLGKSIASLYAPPHHVTSMIGYTKRIVLVGSDPNVAAAIAMLFFLFNLFKTVIYKKRTTLVLTLLLLVILLMTSSRTSILSLGAILLIFLLSSKSISLFSKFLLFSLIVGLFVLLYQEFQYLTIGFEMAAKGKNMSLLHRFENWTLAWELFLESKCWGWGYAKSIHTTVADGEIFLLLRRFGIIGTSVVLFTVYKMPFWLNFKTKKRQLILWSSVLHYYLVVIFFVMITNAFWGGYQLLLPFIYISVLLYQEKKNEKHSSLNFCTS